MDKERYEEAKKYLDGEIDQLGRELLNPEPTTLKTEKRESLADKVKRYIRNELSQTAYEQGYETEEEANDFEMYDEFEDPALPSEYELHDLIPEYPSKGQDEIVPPVASQEVGNPDEVEKNQDPEKDPPKTEE